MKYPGCPVCGEMNGFHDQDRHAQVIVPRHLVWRPSLGELPPWKREQVSR